MKKGLFRLFLALVTLAILLSAVSCVPKTPVGPDPDPEEQEPETSLTIAGKSIANHKILYPADVEGANDLAIKIRSAISNVAGRSLPATTTDPGNGKVIWLKVDPQQSPASCRVYVEGRALILAVHEKSFLSDVVNLFKSTIEGKTTMDFPSDFSVIKNYDVVSYQSAKGEKKMVGDSDKNPLSYAVGETAIFRLAIVSEGKLVSVPYYELAIWDESTGTGYDVKDGTGEKLYIDGTKGYIEYEIANFSKPGFFYLNVKACDESKKKLSGIADSVDGYHYVGSVGFGVDQISPAQTADLDAYWAPVISAVKSQPTTGMKLTEISSTQAGFRAYYWEMPSGGKNIYKENNVAAGYLTVPTGASATNKIGLRITFQAHDGNIPIPDPVYKENTATLIVCAHGFDLEQAKTDSTYYQKQKNRIGNFINSPDYMRDMIKRDLLGARFLLAQFGPSGNNYWDGETFVVAGNSMGAMQSTAVAALTKEVTGTDVSLLDIGIPWLCDTMGATIGRKTRSWPSNLSELVYLDPATFAAKLTCKVQIYGAMGDMYCPASGVMALYNGAKNVEKTITFQQNASHGGGNGGGKYQLSQPSAQ